MLRVARLGRYGTLCTLYPPSSRDSSYGSHPKRVRGEAGFLRNCERPAAAADVRVSTICPQIPSSQGAVFACSIGTWIS